MADEAGDAGFTDDFLNMMGGVSIIAEQLYIGCLLTSLHFVMFAIRSSSSKLE
jgi:hypothetical protein